MMNFFLNLIDLIELKKISNFSGSAGLAIITKKNNYLFVDGRYTIQAKNQAGKYFKILDITNKPPSKILKNIKLGLDPKIFTKRSIKRLFSEKLKVREIEDNLIDKIIKNKVNKNKEFFELSKTIAGESKNSKINRVVKFLKNIKADYLFITAPENIAWLLNIRGNDNPNSPIPNSHMIITRKKNLSFQLINIKLSKIIKNKTINKNQFAEMNEIKSYINQLTEGTFVIDSNSCSLFYENLIKKKFKILKK